ncbi:MAG: 2Fe-2S iron-sulfur cluster-binding protein [Phycisphaeraceae bacterium]
MGAQLLVAVAGSVRRNLAEGRKDRLELDLLQARIAAARRRRLAAAEAEQAWEGSRKFEVAQKVCEADNVHSFHLVPHDQRPLPTFQPGQYLTFQLHVPGRDRPVVRCYSLSEAPREDEYRVTIKRIAPPRDKPDAPPGLASSHFNDRVEPGDILDVKAPHGSFCLDTTRETPVVLIAGGIGVTPIFSMLETIVSTGSPRETWFFYGVRNQREHAFKQRLEALAAEGHNVNLHICYSDPTDDDIEGRDYHHAERVSMDLLQRLLPSNNYDFYICGPAPMMSDLVNGLEEWGVPEQRVHYEAFGPASIKKVAPEPEPATQEATEAGVEVTFARSDKTVTWSDSYDSILDLAEANGIAIDWGCRAGNCGTCLTAIKSGKVKYPKETGVEPENGSCLPCVGKPDGALALDA